MLRTLRLCSASRAILKSENAKTFLETVSARLSDAQSGNLTAPPERISYWEGIGRVQAYLSEKNAEIIQLRKMMEEDKELKAIAEEECSGIEKELDEKLEDLAALIVPFTDMDVLTKCQLELTSGAGGQEAMLFTGELLKMYSNLAQNRGWKWEPFQVDSVPLGGVRSALISVTGPMSYATLRFEAGVHRVQRVPVNDSRMHTSTSSVSVLPEPEEVSVVVPSDSVKIETMRASGPGGQNVNKRSTAVRMTHKETGIAVHCMDERFQHLNIQIAYKRLAAILLQRQLDASNEKVTSDRKLQVGSKARAEKIRTYNFQHDRVTDHRIQYGLTGVEEFLSGGEKLEDLVGVLQEQYKLDRLSTIINQCQVD